ncbi:heterokaryon incompatibility [Diplodia corticola]|uniref:Heterokaryon incompatibility n=1 Tax=Diplodia corticola TaxID=236234 RepID=A0A1J9QRM7_9PEZI|nr:heterokaryon incompatibility [Diplodia corticola]OJD30666.1 heterokaryon incompatibility [Diplodia corticola]
MAMRTRDLRDQDTTDASSQYLTRKRRCRGLGESSQESRTQLDVPRPSDHTFSSTSNLSLSPELTAALRVTNGLCGYCRVLELNDRERGGRAPSSRTSAKKLRFRQSTIELDYSRVDRLRDMPSLSATEKAGCQFCRLLIRSLRSYYGQMWHELDGSETIEISRMRYSWGKHLQSLKVNLVYNRAVVSRSEEFAFPIAAHPGASTEWLGITRRPRYESILSEDGTQLQRGVAEMITGWISGCKDHSALMKNADTLPTRLLDVRNTDAQGGIRLIGSFEHTEVMEGVPWKYAALSHCWGDPARPPLKTTRENIDAMSTSIPFETLPRNYQDAVTVCRSLGIPFLWIDSLCIIQDDKQDWELESPRMAEIYEQAYITIIPTVAKSCHEGFLSRSPLDPRSVAHIAFQSALNPPIQGSYMIEDANFTKDLHVRLQFLRDTKETRWGSRGWTFTEQLFATSRLYFGATGLHWSCDEKYCSELHHGDQQPEEFSLRSYINMTARLSSSQHWKWYRQILEYSSRCLTVPHDRLPAISAFAKKIASMTGDRYLAGLWQSDLSNGLLWQSRGGSDEQQQHHVRANIILPDTPEYVAPSWSWLAQARHADLTHDNPGSPTINARQFIRVMEADTACDGLNPFGRIVDGHLTLQSKAYICLRTEALHPCREFTWSGWEIVSNGSHVAECSFDGQALLPKYVESCGGEAFPAYDLRAQRVLLLAIRANTCLGEYSFIATPNDHLAVSGLILIPSGRRDGEYCRAGVFQSRADRGGGVKLFEQCETWTVTII